MLAGLGGHRIGAVGPHTELWAHRKTAGPEVDGRPADGTDMHPGMGEALRTALEGDHHAAPVVVPRTVLVVGTALAGAPRVEVAGGRTVLVEAAGRSIPAVAAAAAAAVHTGPAEERRTGSAEGMGLGCLGHNHIDLAGEVGRIDPATGVALAAVGRIPLDLISPESACDTPALSGRARETSTYAAEEDRRTEDSHPDYMT